jgi:Peptidase family M28
MQKQFLTFLMLAVFTVGAQTNQQAEKFAATITAKALKEKLTIVAGPEMEGRETATEGERRAAAYIIEQFKKIGLKPGNGDSYLQPFPVYQDNLIEKALRVNGTLFLYDKDYMYNLQASSGGTINTNQIVFVGFGINDETNKWNDYKGLDVKGKIVVALEGSPSNYKAPTPQGNARFTNPATTNGKLATSKANGAAMFVLVSKDFPRKSPSVLKGNMYTRKSELNNFNVSIVSDAVASAMLGRTSNIGFEKLQEVPKGNYIAETMAVIGKQTDNMVANNVVGVLEGTDKKDEYLVLTAHYDHLGKRDTVIYYGADDDGSGTVAVMEMAATFAAAKKKGAGPRRSIVFMTVSGEEKGLWGSDYYSSNPLFPIAKTTANLNTDMVGRTDPKYKGDTSNYVYVIGDDKLSSDLAPLTDSINKTAKMELDRRYNDVSDPNRFYYRSDHYNFAKVGVPIIFYFDGVHADYHRATDTVDRINFALMEKRVRFIFNTAWTIANKEQMLKRDIPLNIPPR